MRINTLTIEMIAKKVTIKYWGIIRSFKWLIIAIHEL